ncbi:hypothetical protein [Constrictibacter sp. MBR-5]|uniref:hypothetical protein n=1 Tax=Constrictibacter sp. MBR-5 TaxID=3156467 RepID=UPI0033943EE4
MDGIRFKHGFRNIQSFLVADFGRFGEWTYNFVVALRLLSEVFANLLVVGIIFGSAGSYPYAIAIVAVAALTLSYGAMGGLRASLKTDVVQMTVLLGLLAALLATVVLRADFAWVPVLASSPDFTSPGWVLLAVALLQVWSYPLHDPVMTDRGFLADRHTTMRSFYHAFWISLVCILAFGLVGVFAGLHRDGDEVLMDTLGRLLGGGTMVLVNLALIVSAVSTLDSTLSSASKLVVVDMRIAQPSILNGRIAMVAFLVGGLGLLFVGSKDLFSAVAVSGTASMFLAPVVFFRIWGDFRVPRWSYATAFALAMSGSIGYFVDSAGHFALFEPMFGPIHDYTKLLIVSLSVLGGGMLAFALGSWRGVKEASA